MPAPFTDGLLAAKDKAKRLSQKEQPDLAREERCRVHEELRRSKLTVHHDIMTRFSVKLR
jgi:hypothetical protein